MEITDKKVIEVSDWDNLVEETYGKPYSFQQQHGCQERGVFSLTVPAPYEDDGMSESIPEQINGDDMGVRFSSWLARDPKLPVGERNQGWEIALFWERNFYPDIQAVANDLNKKGLLPEGEYLINIDW